MNRPIPTSGAATGTTSTFDGQLDWRHRAACLTEDPELFWSTDEADVEAAKAVCGRCPVLGDCRAWAPTAGTELCRGA